VRLLSIAASCLAFALLAGCDDGSEPDASATTSATTVSPTTAATTPTPTTDSKVESEKELKAAVVAYSDAFLTGDSDSAYAIFSKRCKDRMDEAEFAGIVAQAKNLYGSALPLKSLEAQISGDLARVTYTYEVSGIDQDSEPWVREGGRWRQDDC
jgi:hypothetical protein